MQKINSRRANNANRYPHPRVRSADPETLQKLLKEELRMTIMAKRQARGEGELLVEFQEPESHELTAAELERKERRREQNRRAAQRCRRKKRQHQMSVLQNYEWIITHNQQLSQEVEQLRQQTAHLQSVLQAHRDACTCTQTPSKTTSLLPLAPKVKTEPPEDPASSRTGYGSACQGMPSPTSLPHPGSCLYGSSASEVGVARENTAPSTQHQQQQQGGGYSAVQGASYYPTPGCSAPCAFNTSPCSPGVASYQQAKSHHHHHHHNSFTPLSHSHSSSNTSSPHKSPQLGDGSSTHGQHQAVHGSFHGSGSNLVAMDFGGPAPFTSPQVGGVPTSQPHTPPSATGDAHLSLLEELAYLPGGFRSCVFQEEAATPLSADGRRSISSVSSDVSTAASDHHHQQQCHNSDVVREGRVEDMLNDLGTPDAVSQLLSQINQNDLIFQQEGATMDDVFADPVMASSLQEHFLQNI